MRTVPPFAALAVLCLLASLGPALARAEPAPAERAPAERAADRSPVDLAILPDESRLIVANETSGTASLVRLADGKVLAEVECGRRPKSLALAADGRRAVVACAHSGALAVLRIEGDALTVEGRAELGFEPFGVVLAPEGNRAYVSLAASGEVAVVDLTARRVLAKFPVGQWPRHMALTPDGKRLVVGLNGDRALAVVDLPEGKVRVTEPILRSVNLGHLQLSPDGKTVYFGYMVYRENPINPQNIRLGWVLASRLGRLTLDPAGDAETISLDPPGKAISDPHGLALTPDGKHLLATAPGTHELLLYQTAALNWKKFGGSGDHVEGFLLGSRERFDRVELGGRPMAVRLSADGARAYVANYLSNSIQVIDWTARRVTREIDLGGPETPSLARQGEAIFYDGRRSLDQWYSCHSCHFEGGGNAVTMDTWNDGSPRTPKTVLPLFHVHQTAPWTWHGWQQDLDASLKKSLADTMQMPPPSDADVERLRAFLETLALPPNPFREPGGKLSAAAERGQRVFAGEKANCAKCHRGPLYTDGLIHDVGQGSPADVYKGYNTPSLVGVYRRVRLLHHGRARSLEEALSTYHRPEDVAGQGGLSAEELADLIAFLKSL